ncbi:MAG: hypothetical protein IIT56_00985, partial [Bacteroidales bacterium]|nr:hypothetical protein [Bacteroidales bacterium]
DGKDGQNGTNGTNGENGNDGTIIVWKGSLSAEPASPAKGWCYYNSTAKKSYMYDGTKWQMIAQDGQNGTLIVWKGALENAPESPVTGWTYYNTTDKKSYMYANSAWQMIAQDGKDYEPPVFAFTVNAEGKKVVFSPGNLQYNTSTHKFQFAANQLECMGTNQATIKDLFGWGMWLDGTDEADIIKTSQNSSDYSPELENGVFKNNKTTVDGTEWFTLTVDEWTYIKTNSAKAWKEISVGGTTYKGLVILPDGCTYGENDIANTEWSELETAGAVFLPAAGYRNGTGVDAVGSNGYYWSATPDGVDFAQLFGFDSGNSAVFPDGRYFGYSVRLVRSLQ